MTPMLALMKRHVKPGAGRQMGRGTKADTVLENRHSNTFVMPAADVKYTMLDSVAVMPPYTPELAKGWWTMFAAPLVRGRDSVESYWYSLAPVHM
jgi:hypothetical protein